jgi:hypothetical protein
VSALGKVQGYSLSDPASNLGLSMNERSAASVTFYLGLQTSGEQAGFFGQLEAEPVPPCREKFIEAWWTHIGLLHEPRN